MTYETFKKSCQSCSGLFFEHMFEDCLFCQSRRCARCIDEHLEAQLVQGGEYGSCRPQGQPKDSHVADSSIT